MRRSLNQVFMRSVNTTLITILPVLSMLILGQFVFGQQTLGDFSLALLIGLISGTYSSLFVAAPLTTWLKEREPRFREIRSRLVARGRGCLATPPGRAWPSRGPLPPSGVPVRPSASVASGAVSGAGRPVADDPGGSVGTGRPRGHASRRANR